MTTSTQTSTEPAADIDAVRAVFEAFASRDLAALGDAASTQDATWNHRNDDRLGGVHQGSDGDRRIPRRVRAAHRRHPAAGRGRSWRTAQGHVVVLMRISGTRPDGRTFDDPRSLVFTLDGDRVRSVDQYIGDPAAVTAFWA